MSFNHLEALPSDTVLYNSWDVDMEREKLQDANIKIYEAQAEPITHATCKPSLTKCSLGCPRAILFGYVQHVRMFRYDVSRHEALWVGLNILNLCTDRSKANDLKVMRRTCGFTATRLVKELVLERCPTKDIFIDKQQTVCLQRRPKGVWIYPNQGRLECLCRCVQHMV